MAGPSKMILSVVAAATLALATTGAAAVSPVHAPAQASHPMPPRDGIKREQVESAFAPSNFSACDPLVPQKCAMPFPNNFWLRPSASQGGALRLELGNKTLPMDNSNKPIRADYGGWNSLDGFSPIPSILAYFPNVSIDNCARLWDVSASVAPTSPTIVLDADTGELVPHWVELDHMSDDTNPDGYERALMIWPAHRLASAGRYIVAIRGLVTDTGAAVTVSEGFAALRDGTPTTDPNIEGRRELFKDIFSKLAAIGVKVPELQLAWDFTVGTRSSITGRMVAMRDDAFTRVPNGTSPKYAIDSVTHNFSSTIDTRIQGHFYVPWYLNEVGLLPTKECRLVLDAAGNPVYQSMQSISFTVLVPRSLIENGTTGRIMQYGHGLFGDQSEVQEGYLDAEANEYGYVLGAVDWMGLSAYDEAGVALMMANDLSDFAMVPDRCSQGMLNALFMMKLMRTGLVTEPSMQFNGKPVIDPTRTSYYGNSQGGILGTVYSALSTEVTKSVIGVGGGPYGLLLPRSADFSTLGFLLKARYGQPLDRPVLQTVFQLLWDRLEPSGYLDAITSNPLPNTPKHRILVHYGLGDAQVTWLGGQMIGRSTGCSMYESNVASGNVTLYGFPFMPDTAVNSTGSVIVGWRFAGIPEVPYINVPPPKQYDTHEKTRRTMTAQAMTARFLETGDIVNTCNGPCSNVSLSVWDSVQ